MNLLNRSQPTLSLATLTQRMLRYITVSDTFPSPTVLLVIDSLWESIAIFVFLLDFHFSVKSLTLPREPFFIFFSHYNDTIRGGCLSVSFHVRFRDFDIF